MPRNAMARKQFEAGERMSIDGKIYLIVSCDRGKLILSEVLPGGRIATGKFPRKRDRRMRKQTRHEQKTLAKPPPHDVP